MNAYGKAGRYGVGTPQSNPTVETELGVLLPRAATLHVTRLTSTETTPVDRLREYLERLDDYLDAFDGMKLDAFGFACTGSSYLLGATREAKIARACEARVGYPVLTAADSIVWALDRLRARRIAVVAPYPAELIDAGVRYFRSRGIDPVVVQRVTTRTLDTRTIYETTADDARVALAGLDLSGVDAVLVSGTGMPSLAVVDSTDAPPVISSNLCLAARMLNAAGRRALVEANGIDPRGWRARLAEAIG